MKISLKTTLFIGLLTSLSGCFMGELGVYGQAREDYLKSIKPMRDRWDRANSLADIWKQDWIECGGTESGGFSPRQEVLAAEMRTGEAFLGCK